MKLLIAGGTGFIGTPLCHRLVQHGHELTVLSRTPQPRCAPVAVRFLSWDHPEWRRLIASVDGVINLAGESLAAKRWTPRQKALLRDSRLQTTRALVDAIAASDRKPAVLINASAIGYYGARNDEELGEADPTGRGFLAELCVAWEAEARRAEALGVRVVRLRIGVVLGRGGGALAKMVPPFRWFAGGPLGSGRQWVSWIHRDDVTGLIAWALARSDVSGPINATAPQPVRMREFSATLGRALKRPSWAPVPAAALRLLVGEFAEALVTGQRVLPQAALRGGYAFAFPTLASALEACVTPPVSDIPYRSDSR